jgi:signal transduction histidine kinase
MEGPAIRTTLGSVALALVYYATARAGLSVATVGHSVTLVWPPTGLAIGVLLMAGMRFWPGVALGAFLVNVTTPGVPFLAATGMACGNTLEAALATWLLLRSGFDPALRRVPDVLRLFTLGALVSALPSALIGSLSLLGGGVIGPAQLPSALRSWWVGDLMGALIVAPAIWSVRGLRGEGWPRKRRLLEAVAVAIAVIGVTALVFNRRVGGQAGPNYLRSYCIFPVLLWAALRFESRGAAWANFGVSVLAIAATLRGLGPYALGSPGENLLTLQIFMGIAVLTSQVIASAAAERSDAIRAREDFISIASHELRTPLTPLMLQIDRLRRRLARGQLAVADLSRIEMSLQRQADRLTGLVDILLDVTRLRSGRMALDREPLDLVALARETVDSLSEEIERAGCPVSIDGPRPVLGRWDRTRLQQAITNLVGNAVKYGAGAAIAVNISGDDGTARLVVRDEGPGIAFPDQSRLFRRFARLPSARGRAGGLGLGLYITREILEAHGGSIHLDSRPGHGASFTCVIPVATPAPATPA